MNPQIQGCMEKIREMNVSEKKKTQLCSVLAGIENNNNEEAKLESGKGMPGGKGKTRNKRNKRNKKNKKNKTKKVKRFPLF